MHPLAADLLSSEPIRPLKRSEYDQLVELGAFEDERVELLYGRIVEMSPQKGPHATAIRRSAKLLARALGDRAEVQVQLPLAASDDSEPEPDLAVIDGVDHVDDHPASAYLVVEVADSSRRKDLVVKAPVYAAMPVPDYWVLDVEREELIVHRDPGQDGYRQISTFARGDQIAMLAFPDVVLPIDEMLPPRR